MPTITFPRTGIDGDIFTQKDIENWYISTFYSAISHNIVNDVTPTNDEEINCRCCILTFLKEILLAPPIVLNQIVKFVDKRKLKGQWVTKKFSNALLKAFNYKDYRKGKLTKLAAKLNVKSCCYCNMNYTVVTDESRGWRPKYKALLQFDHFFDKDTYPFLSMSLYNLIPSCGTCNQRKMNGQLPIEFNPYYGNLYSYYRYRIKDPLALFTGDDNNDRIHIILEKKSSVDITPLNENFHLETRYQMHKDIIQEIYDKSYMLPYYASYDNFTFMDKDKSYPLRLLLGTYPDEKDFEKRPMSKFVKDIWDDTRSWTLLQSVKTGF